MLSNLFAAASAFNSNTITPIGQLLINTGAYRGSAGSAAQDVIASIAYIRITKGVVRD